MMAPIPIETYRARSHGSSPGTLPGACTAPPGCCVTSRWGSAAIVADAPISLFSARTGCDATARPTGAVVSKLRGALAEAPMGRMSTPPLRTLYRLPAVPASAKGHALSSIPNPGQRRRRVASVVPIQHGSAGAAGHFYIMGPNRRIHMYVHREEIEVPANPDPDEGIVIDFAIARDRIYARMVADGAYCDRDAAAMDAFERPFQRLSIVVRLRNGLESLIRNGLTRRTEARAREALIQVVVVDGYPVNVTPLYPEPVAPEAA